MNNHLLTAIFSNQIAINQRRNGIHMVVAELVLVTRKPDLTDRKYWRISRMETNDGDDLLQIKEQKTPEPLQYEVLDENTDEYAITASSYTFQQQLIKNISAFGFKVAENHFLTSLLIALENKYVLIEAGLVTTVKISQDKPNLCSEIIF